MENCVSTTATVVYLSTLQLRFVERIVAILIHHHDRSYLIVLLTFYSYSSLYMSTLYIAS